MSPTRLLTLALLVLALPRPATAQGDGTWVVRDLAPGVFAAVRPEGVPPYLFANAVVVIGEDGVLVVDSGQRPALARQLIGLIRERTDRPVRWLVNTHWHGDHVWGNAVFRDTFPNVRILATPSTRDSIATGARRQVGEQIERHRQARTRLAAMRDTADAALAARIDAADSVRVERIRELERLDVVVPTGTFDSPTVVDLGGRAAALLPVGPAHTPGDAVVWLPESGILAAGDVLEEGELWLDGADVAGWLGALDVITDLDPAVLVPSHGDIADDGSLIEAAREQLEAARD